MLGLESILQQMTGGGDALIMLGAFSLLILLNFLTSMWVEVVNKDLRWNDLTRFIHPILLNALFLLGIELVMIPAARLPLAYEVFSHIQMLGWLGVMTVYFYGFYKNLKKLGLKTNQQIDNAIEELNETNKKED